MRSAADWMLALSSGGDVMCLPCVDAISVPLILGAPLAYKITAVDKPNVKYFTFAQDLIPERR